VWFTRFLVSLGYYMIQPYLSNFLKDRVRDYSLFGLSLGDDPEKTTMAAAALGLTIALFGALGAATSIRLTDRWGRKRVVQSSGIVMLAALLPFPWILNYSSLWCLSVVFGVGYGAYLSADWALASDVLPIKGDEGKDMGVWQMSVSSVQLAAGMFGRVIDALNRLGPGWGYTAVFMGAGVFFLLGTSLVTRIRGST
jgi:MFS family permease